MNVAAILNEKGREVATLGLDAKLIDVARTLDERGIGSIVIVDENGGVAGIVSERDVVRTIARHGMNVLSEPVADAMTEKVVTCAEADTIEQIMSDMTSHRFRHMPVMESGRLVGIVSIGDVVKQRIAEAEMEAAAMRSYIATG